MSGKKDIAFLLKAFSIHQNTAQFDLLSFCLFAQKYAAKYSDQYSELKEYENISTEAMSTKLQELKKNNDIEYTPQANGNAIIAVAHYYIEKIKRIFSAISEKPSIAFPTTQDLPRDISSTFIKKCELDDEFAKRLPTKNSRDYIIQLNFGPTLPIMVFPSSMSSDTVLLFSLLKLKKYLEKDETSDYIYKRLMTANSGKNFTVKSFLSTMQNHSQESLKNIKEAGETYLLWGQVCSFIIQELDKKSEKLAEELSLLQGVRIIEFMSTYYRTKNQKKLQSETALKNLGLCLQQSPYYFTTLAISAFKDSRGIPLLGQYEQQELQAYINKKTTECSEYSLPDLLTFKNESNETLFVHVSKVIPLIILLINQSRKKIQEACIKIWQQQIQNFVETPAMKDDKAFDNFLKTITREHANTLFSLLESKFLSSIAADKKIMETQAIEYGRVFPQGKLAPFSKLLLLDRNETLGDTKILLPFWYTVPFLYAIMSFFKRKKTKAQQETTANKNDAKPTAEQKPQKQDIKVIAKELRDSFLPEGETYDEAMKRYLHSWNQNLNTVLRDNLTEDVNALIRDYIRGIQRTLHASSLSRERIKELANTIVRTPSLLKITDKNALQKYCELYILDLIQKFF